MKKAVGKSSTEPGSRLLDGAEMSLHFHSRISDTLPHRNIQIISNLINLYMYLT